MEKLENGIRQLDYTRTEMINNYYMLILDKKQKELIEALDVIIKIEALDAVINSLLEEYISILEG